MKTVIYADVLIIINFIVNYLMLRASTAITGHSFKIWRILLSALCGGFFSLIIFEEDISLILNIIIKAIMFVIMVLIAFINKNLKSFLKCCASFALVNFAFGGIMLAFTIFFFPNSSAYINGVVYFDTSLLSLTCGAIGCYLILNLISRFTKSKVPQKSIYEIRLHYNGKTAEGKALFDSGNTLCDCFSGRPVIIAEKDFAKKLFGNSDMITLKNFRLIPFSTIKNSGALPSFMADKTEININGKWVESKEIYIAVTEKKIVSGGYSALFGAPYLETFENYIKGGSIKI